MWGSRKEGKAVATGQGPGPLFLGPTPWSKNALLSNLMIYRLDHAIAAVVYQSYFYMFTNLNIYVYLAT